MESMKQRSILVENIAAIESLLRQLYGFELEHGAVNFIIDFEQKTLLEQSGLARTTGRAQTLVCSKDDDLELAVYFNDEIISKLQTQNPLEALSISNIDVFCAVVEEISHFHLLINRASYQQTISLLELELQAEVDKLLICAQVLWQQTDKPHYVPLARILFDLAQFPTDDPRYQRANHLAGEFCFRLIEQIPEHCPPMALTEYRQLLRRFYLGTMAEKLNIVSRARTLAAA
jgi:hypothetical protein